jgi:hyperosmotically inducible periplasmic protein
MLKIVTRAGIALLFILGSVQLSAQTTPQTTDAKLKDRIEHRLETNKNLRKYDIKVKVDAGKATLTGDVATAAQKTEAGTVAKVTGVSSVTNSITVNADVDRTLAERSKSGLNKLGEKITDAWITTKVKWVITGEDALEGSNINVDTANNVVTLKGTVKTQAGKARAVALAKDVDGVKSVVDQLTIAK